MKNNEETNTQVAILRNCKIQKEIDKGNSVSEASKKFSISMDQYKIYNKLDLD